MAATELLWVTAAEEEPIARLQASLARVFHDWPSGYPTDLTHDVYLCRFLRGNKGDEVKALEKLRAAISYRSELIGRSQFRDMREAIGTSRDVDLTLVPYAAEMLPVLPLRSVEGSAKGSLPALLTLTRFIDFDAFSALAATESESDMFTDFMQGMLEQRALILHNRSVAEQRMVKFVDVRDLNGVYVSEILSRGRPLIQRAKTALALVQDYYPEVLHQVVVYNAPSMFSKIFALISSTLNEQMRDKIAILPAGGPFASVVERFDARAIHSWCSELTSRLPWSDITVPNGSTEFCSSWLEVGQTLHWTVTLRKGPDIKVRYAFVPEGGGLDSEENTEVLPSSDESAVLHRSFVAVKHGVFWLCLDNSAAYWHSKTCSVELRVQPSE